MHRAQQEEERNKNEGEESERTSGGGGGGGGFRSVMRRGTMEMLSKRRTTETTPDPVVSQIPPMPEIPEITNTTDDDDTENPNNFRRRYARRRSSCTGRVQSSSCSSFNSLPEEKHEDYNFSVHTIPLPFESTQRSTPYENNDSFLIGKNELRAKLSTDPAKPLSQTHPPLPLPRDSHLNHNQKHQVNHILHCLNP